jgi:hypothetical protein
MIFKKDKLGQISFIFMMGTLYFLSSNSIYPGARTMNVFSVPFNSDIDYSSRLSRIYPDFTLEKNVVNLIGESTVDVYPYNNEYIFSNKLNYFHRPLFQNYMTLTPKLDTINKKFFVSAERPKFILWTAAITCTASNCDPFIEIDNKYVLNEDPLTTNSILSNYHIVMLTKGKGNIPILLLEENNSYTETKETVISKTVMKFNHWYMVPTATLGITKVVPHFEFTIAGRLKNLFFRGNVVNIYYKTYSGEIKNYRLNILNSISGVWVSPLINKMNNSGFIGDNVESIMFQTNDINYFKPNFESIFIKSEAPKGYSQSSNNTPESYFPIDFKKLEIFNVNCEGHIDSTKIVSIGMKDDDEKKMIMTNGWLALSTAKGLPFDKIIVTLIDNKEQKIFFPSSTQPRNDVAQVFNSKQLSDSGFKSTVAFPDLNSEYKISLAGYVNNKLYYCQNLITSLPTN